MTPDQQIASLDRMIATRGQIVKLRKGTAKSDVDDWPALAFVRGYRPDELAGGIQQGDSTMILSPTALAVSGFDGTPKRNDKVIVAGRVRNIEVIEPVAMNDVVVRYNLWLRG